MAGKFGLCRFCLQQKKLIKAHIIPKSFQSSLKDVTNKMLVLHLQNDNGIQQVNDFGFDKEILCKECDNTFSDSENYTAKFLEDFKNNSLITIKSMITTEGHRDLVFTPNLFKIKNCLLSILWRMSISENMQFRNVQLGPLEDVLRRKLNTQELMVPDFFPFTIFSLKRVNDLKAKMLSPFVPKFKHRGSPVYFIHLPEFLICVYASKRVLFDPNILSIKQNGELWIAEENGIGLQKYLSSLYKTIPETKRY